MSIIKILSRSSPSYKSLLTYILKESKNDKLEIHSHNLRSDSVHGWTREFIENEAYRKITRSNQCYLYHEIISFSNEEFNYKLTPTVLRKLAEEYFRLRGAESVGIAATHRDREHIHIHFAISGLKYRTGKSARISKAELLKLKQDFQKYHNQELGITKSNPEHGKSRLFLNDKERYAIMKDVRIRKREELSEVIQVCLKKTKSKREFFNMLLDNNLPYYERNGVATGIVVDEKKYRFSSLDLDKEKYQQLLDSDNEVENAISEIGQIRSIRKQTKDIEDRDLGE